MTVFVDELEEYGWVLRGRKMASCHLFTDTIELDELHALAQQIGMRRSWFQNKQSAPHYDLTPDRRLAAISSGAVPVDRRQAVGIWRQRRAAIAKAEAMQA